MLHIFTLEDLRKPPNDNNVSNLVHLNLFVAALILPNSQQKPSVQELLLRLEILAEREDKNFDDFESTELQLG